MHRIDAASVGEAVETMKGHFPVLLVLLMLIAAGCEMADSDMGGIDDGHETPQNSGDPQSNFPEFPLAAEGRRLADNAGRPFAFNGDTPWSLAVQLSPDEVVAYLDNRAGKGVNAIIFNAVENQFSDNPPRNYRGDLPFIRTLPGGEEDFTSPNDAYWDHVEFVVREAASRGMACIMLPAYIGYQHGLEGWAEQVAANGDRQMEDYGEWLAGTRFAGHDNIIWAMGGDWDRTHTYDLVSEYNALAQGILNAAPRALITAHSAPGRSSLDDYDEPWLSLNWVYRYPGHGQPEGVRQAYEATRRDGERTMPSFWGEGHYENEHNSSPTLLRSQMWWSILGGLSAGHFYGSNPVWHFDASHADGFEDSNSFPFDTWQNALDAEVANDLTHIASFLERFDISTLEPDYARKVATTGRGSLLHSNWMAAARESHGFLVLAYTPSRRAVTIDMTSLRRPADVEWYNPRTGALTAVASEVENVGMQSFTPPAEGDWVLVVRVP